MDRNDVDTVFGSQPAEHSSSGSAKVLSSVFGFLSLEKRVAKTSWGIKTQIRHQSRELLVSNWGELR